MIQDGTKKKRREKSDHNEWQFAANLHVVSNHLDQIGSGPKSWIQTVVATRISPKNFLRGPREGYL